jgi:hypothetical protein
MIISNRFLALYSKACNCPAYAGRVAQKAQIESNQAVQLTRVVSPARPGWARDSAAKRIYRRLNQRSCGL